jgi:predicted transcriptional regulator
VRVRRVWIDPKVKSRFDDLARNGPVSSDVLMREAIFRFTGAC